MTKLMLLGPPGCGKGTQTEVLSQKLGLPILSTGHMLREAIAKKTSVGFEAEVYMNDGRLVPDDLIIAIILQRLREPDCEKGFILDGFPRTLPQAKALYDAGIRLDHVVLMEVADAIIQERMQGRLYHPGSNRTYHILFSPPKEEGLDDITGEPLAVREDDLPETVQKRLSIYHELTHPLIEYYQSLMPKGFHCISGVGDVDAITQRILKVI